MRDEGGMASYFIPHPSSLNSRGLRRSGRIRVQVLFGPDEVVFHHQIVRPQTFPEVIPFFLVLAPVRSAPGAKNQGAECHAETLHGPHLHSKRDWIDAAAL